MVSSRPSSECQQIVVSIGIDSLTALTGPSGSESIPDQLSRCHHARRIWWPDDAHCIVLTCHLEKHDLITYIIADSQLVLLYSTDVKSRLLLLQIALLLLLLLI